MSGVSADTLTERLTLGSGPGESASNAAGRATGRGAALSTSSASWQRAA